MRRSRSASSFPISWRSAAISCWPETLRMSSWISLSLAIVLLPREVVAQPGPDLVAVDPAEPERVAARHPARAGPVVFDPGEARPAPGEREPPRAGLDAHDVA